jgi:phosphoglycolate phosphatase-like HAD superfamily hydrolase
MAAYLDRLPYEVDHSDGYRVLEGAQDLLPRLGQREGVLLGITSGAVEAAAHIKLSRAGFNRYFPFGGYGSDSPDRVELTRRAIERGGRLVGEELDPADVFVVGDTPKDVEAAHGAGCVAVATATGHYSREQLEATGAEHVLDSLLQPFPGID